MAFVIIMPVERVFLMKQKQAKYSKTTLGKFIRALFSKETPTYIKAIVGLAVAYTVMPLDILPDLLGVFGFVDDAAVIGVLTTIAMTLLDNYNNQAVETNQNTGNSDRNFEEVD